MKILNLFIALLLISPAFALCPVNSGESVCNLPNYGSNQLPIFQDENSEANMNKTQPQLQPFHDNNNMNQINDNNIFNNQTGCQFGICNQGFDKSLQKDN